MRDVYVIGAHTIRFGKHLDRGIKDLAIWTVTECLKDAGLEKEAIEALWFSNSGWDHAKGQSCIRGQVALRPMGIDAIPITNVENACASGSTAFHHAWLAVTAGACDVTMAVGAEKLYHPNKYHVFSGFLGGIDIENCVQIAEGLSVFRLTPEEKKDLAAFKAKYQPARPVGEKKKKTLKERLLDLRYQLAEAVMLGEKLGYDTVKKMSRLSAGDHSPFMDIYGYAARQHMKKYGSTVEQLAIIASKSHFNSTLNPNAQYRFEVPVEKVLADRIVSFPVTRAMCAPIGDGAASAILCSEEKVRQLGLMDQAVRVRASILGSGRARTPDEPEIGERLAKKAYAVSGLGPKEIDLAEVHDATAYGEMVQAENLGFCPKGEGGRLAEQGETRLGGKIPINTSGGLVSRGHPIGASGLAQIHELVTQLRGAAGKRQVEGARLGMAENGGGALGTEEAAMCIHILEAPARA
ncbi:thiolase family protein [Desulfosudis oleivorans]|uniref:propanoyl-CoA C-acyltransferase n=1 Tax=Desulfosudis oleivorans (strain DSM 6200 / JCM 39069 / Hxd3) TaxID=96561 RepID=A8ZSL0_DESOH|nr:thiolase family protein [Desulfosudis oleivorans]ABW65923.1 Propanoyl-CoA C-acyltransferase [Desulfosudis oleivorans Hxd3]